MCYKQKVRKENSLMGEDGGGGYVSGNIKLKNSCIGGTPQQELDFNWFFLQQNTHNYVLVVDCHESTDLSATKVHPGLFSYLFILHSKLNSAM